MDTRWSVSLRRSKATAVFSHILAYPDDDANVGTSILDTDANNGKIGGVLSQIQWDGKEKRLCYSGWSSCDAKRRYYLTRKQHLVVNVSSHWFRVNLLDWRFTLRTDHQSLRWLLNLKDLLNQLARWQEELLCHYYRKYFCIKISALFAVLPSFFQLRKINRIISNIRLLTGLSSYSQFSPSFPES